MAERLSPKRERFCIEYCLDWNATQAAIRAGYAQPSAHVQAHHLLRNPKVAARITEIVAASSVTADEVSHKMAAIARGEWTRYLQLGQNKLPQLDVIQMRDDGLGFLLEGFSVSERGAVRWEFAKAQRAIEMIGKTLGTLTESPREERAANSAFCDLVQALQASIREEG